MRPLRTRTDLIDLITPVVTPACRAAITSGIGECAVLGAFTGIQGFNGWVVKITSARRQQWIVAVLVDELNRKYKMEYLEEVPWDNCTKTYLPGVLL